MFIKGTKKYKGSFNIEPDKIWHKQFQTEHISFLKIFPQIMFIKGTKKYKRSFNIEADKTWH